MNLAKVDEIKAAINALSLDETLYLWDWFSEKEWMEWDAQLGADSMSGKLDFLIKEAFSEKSRNELREL